MSESYREIRKLIRADLHRYYGRCDFRVLAKELLFGAGFKYTFWMRHLKYFQAKSFLFAPLALFSRFMYRRYVFKFGFEIAHIAEIGPGLMIGHCGQVIVHPKVVIGRNCNISQGVTIGVSNRGENAGVATVGDDVYIGPGAKIIGKISIGNRVAIGANAVVTKDVPDDGVVVGIPAKLISYKGSEGYINNTDYEE